MKKLNALGVQRINKPGRYGDGDGLYLQVTASGTKSWIFRYMRNRRSREMGLGPCELVSLGEARIKATECRKVLLNGFDPIDERNEELNRQKHEATNLMTFDEAAAQYIGSHRASWKSTKHADQWTNTLKTYASPVIGHIPVQEIDTVQVMKILEPIWLSKNETALRLRSRLELILAWATVRNYRRGENPAVWRNHLEQLLPKQSRSRRVKHHPALPFENIGSFMADLNSMAGTASRALEFLVLTATRTSETLNAQWTEFRVDEQLWIIPADRMKGGVEHRVPLSHRALEILSSMEKLNGNYVFPGSRRGRPLSNMALLKVLERMQVDVVTHGFRSSFRDWAAERTNFPREVCEQALAHSLRDKVEAAYRRGDLLLKRRALMDQWAQYCVSGKPKVAAVTSIQSLELVSIL